MGRCAAILPGRLQPASETSSETYCQARILATVLTNEGENATTVFDLISEHALISGHPPFLKFKKKKS